MGTYHAAGFFAFFGLLASIVYRPVIALCSKSLAAFAAWRANRQSVVRPLRWSAFAAAPIVGTIVCPWELSVVGDVEMVALKKVEVRAEIAGLINEVLVRDGTVVSADQLLARQSDRGSEAELSEVEAQLRQKQAELDLLKAGAHPKAVAFAEAQLLTARTRYEHSVKRLDEARAAKKEQLQRARLAIEQAETELRFAEADLKRHQSLVRGKAVSAAKFQEAREKVAACGARLEVAKSDERVLLAGDLAEFREQLAVSDRLRQEAVSKLELLRTEPRSEQLAAAEAAVEGLISRRKHLLEAIDSLNITSPIDGTVTTAHLDQLSGRLVQSGELIATVQQLDTLRVELSVSEKEVGDIQPGQTVEFRVLAYPNRSFQGEVKSVSTVAVEESTPNYDSSRRFIVTTMVDNASGLLRPGMTGKAKIRCGKRSMSQLFARKLSHCIRVEFWSWW